MKLTKLTVAMLALSGFGFGAGAGVAPVRASCVQADVSVQYSISGSKKPTPRSNDVQMEKDPQCSGNTSVTTGVQGHVGPGSVEQHRQVRHRQQGGNGNRSGVNGPTVQVEVKAPVDVYNPAYQGQHQQ